MIVCKFGGKATTSQESILNIKKICKKKSRKVFVFSAIGSNSTDKKLTDLLIEFCESNNYKLSNKILINIQQKFLTLCKYTNANINIKKEITRIINKYNKNKNKQYLISRGEYLTSKIMSKYLNIKFIPAENVIFFKNNEINYQKTQNKLQKYIQKYKKIIIPGFYGIDENKKIILFSRGGGDITGAIIAKALNFNKYENWTDINGVMQVNPNIIKSNQIYKLDYKDLDLMTSCDANVIHNECVKILKDTNIKLLVKNIFYPNNKPTQVVNHYSKINSFIVYKQMYNKINIFIKQKNGYIETIECDQYNYKKIIECYYKISC